MASLYELGSITLIKDRFGIQNDLDDLKRTEIDTRKLCLTGSRGRLRMGRWFKYAHMYAGKDRA